MRHLKHEFDKLSFKEFFSYMLALVCMVAGITMSFIGMFIPPEGELHPTILTFFGISLGFAGSIIGINIHYDSQLQKFKTEISEQVKKIAKSTK